MKIVIRAGGIGTRLWPMSRTNNPKQFQVVSGDKTMIRTTYDRVAPVLSDKSDLFLSVNEKFKERAMSEIPEAVENRIIIETDTRNTGPAMCLEVCYLEKYCEHSDVIATLPSDDYISDSAAFRELLLATEEFIIKNPDYILTPAIKPNYPDTGYTYFKAGKNLQEKGEETIYSVADVVQKPNDDYCKEIINTGVYYCHTGMYLWQLGHIVGLFKKHQKKMYDICTEIVDLMVKNPGSKKIAEMYSQLEKISVESAVTEYAEKIAMSVSNRIGWSDLGKWHVIKRILMEEEKGNLTKGEVMIKDSSNSMIYSNVDKKLVVVNDVNDLVVIDTPDVLFVSSLKNSAEVKKMVEQIKKEGKDKYL